MRDIVDLIARICIAFIFLFEAYDSIHHFKATKAAMTNYGLTWNQDMVISIAIFLLALGGTLILLGYRSKLGATLILFYWIPITFIMHSFWNDPASVQREQLMLFMKNIAIIGGLLMVVINGSGRFSVKRLFATAKVPGA